MAHEFHHACQNRYYSEYDVNTRWLFESTAVFMEDIIYDDINTLYIRLESGNTPLNMTFLQINYPFQNYQYTTALWLIFLSEYYNNEDIPKLIWEWFGANPNKSTIEANEYVIENYLSSNMETAFRNYAIYRYFTGDRSDGSHFIEAELYPTSVIHQVHNSYPASGDNGSYSIQSNGGTSFIQFMNESFITISFDGQDDFSENFPFNWSADVICFNEGFESTIFSIVLSDNYIGDIEILNQCDHVALVATVGAAAFMGGFYGDYSYTVDIPSTIPITFYNMIGEQDAGDLLIIDNSQTVSSGMSIDLLVNSSHEVKTNIEIFEDWQQSGYSFKHHDWNDQFDHYYLTESFIANVQNLTMDANFLRLDPVQIYTAIGNTIIQINDPWWVDGNGEQPGDAFIPANENYKVFLNQGGEVGNLTPPYYTLRAPRIAATTDGIWEFDYWQVTVGSANFSAPNSNQTAVVFLQENTTIEAVYLNAVTTQGKTITVSSNETLTIPAGANYNITNTAFRLDIHGTLNMVSTSYNRIKFDAPAGSNWGDFYVHTGAELNMEYVDIKDAHDFYWSNPSNATIRNTRFYDINYVWIDGGQLNIENSTIERCSNSLYLEGVTSTITNTTIKDNGVAGIRAYSGDVSLSDVTISGCPEGLFYNAFTDQLSITNSVISNGTKGIVVQYTDNVNITYSVINDFSETGIVHEIANYQTGKYITIRNTTIANSPDGIKCIIPRGARTNLEIENSILAADNSPYVLDINTAYGGSIIADVSYSDFYSLNGLSFDTENWIGNDGNIGSDPLFVDAGSGDFQITSSSPCRDSGNPNQTDPDGTRIDMGAYFYDSPPNAPANLEVSPVNGHPYLTWNPNSELDFDHYNVWAKYTDRSHSSDWLIVATTTNTYWTDNNVQNAGGRPLAFIEYKLTAEDWGGNTSNYSNTVLITGEVLFWPMSKTVSEYTQIPVQYLLNNNFPNPFNPTTTINYGLPEESYVVLVVYDLKGREITTLINRNEQAGYKGILWNGHDKEGNRVPAGIYIYRLSASSIESNKTFAENRKMILLK